MSRQVAWSPYHIYKHICSSFKVLKKQLCQLWAEIQGTNLGVKGGTKVVSDILLSKLNYYALAKCT